MYLRYVFCSIATVSTTATRTLTSKYEKFLHNGFIIRIYNLSVIRIYNVSTIRILQYRHSEYNGNQNTDIEVTSDSVNNTPLSLQVRRGSEPNLNVLSPIPNSNATAPQRPLVYKSPPNKRWSAAPVIDDDPLSSTPRKVGGFKLFNFLGYQKLVCFVRNGFIFVSKFFSSTFEKQGNLFLSVRLFNRFLLFKEMMINSCNMYLYIYIFCGWYSHSDFWKDARGKWCKLLHLKLIILTFHFIYFSTRILLIILHFVRFCTRILLGKAAAASSSTSERSEGKGQGRRRSPPPQPPPPPRNTPQPLPTSTAFPGTPTDAPFRCALFRYQKNYHVNFVIKQNFDCNYTFPIYLPPNKILFDAKSIVKL